jgi:hypothetical protein
MDSSKQVIREKIEIAFSSLDQIQNIFSLHTFTDILDRDQNKSRRIERFFGYCTAARLLHSHVLGIFAAYFTAHINLATNISSEISMIHGYFNKHLYLDAPDPSLKNPIVPYAIAIQHVERLGELIEQLKQILVDATLTL